MNPVPPSEYPRDQIAPYEPYKGDRIYVAIDALITIASYVMTFLMVPALTEQAIAKQKAGGGPQADPTLIQNVTMGFIGCTVVVCVPIAIVLWIFTIKGKLWAFITGIVFAILGLLNGIYSIATNPIVAIGAVALVTSIIRLGYLGARTAGAIGPKPR